MNLNVKCHQFIFCLNESQSKCHVKVIIILILQLVPLLIINTIIHLICTVFMHFGNNMYYIIYITYKKKAYDATTIIMTYIVFVYFYCNIYY